MVNIMGKQAQIIRDAVDKMYAVQDAYVAASPDITGTPLDGVNLANIVNSMNAIDAEIGKAIWSGMIAAIVPTHRDKALG